MRMPPDEVLDVAIMWLESHEVEGDEDNPCTAVAKWIEHMMHERNVRYVARKAGVTPARARRELLERTE